MNRSLQQPIDSLAPMRGPALIWLLALILLASACLVGALFWQLFNPPQASGFMGVGLLSKRVANYSADPRSLSFPPKDASFLGDTLRDKDPYATDLPVRLETLQVVMEEPIPTATPRPEPTSSPGAAGTFQPEITSSPTAGPAASTTPTPSPTPTGTHTVTPTPTFTVTASVTVTATPSVTQKATLTATPTCAPSTSSTNSCTPTPVQEPGASPTLTPNSAVTVPVKPTLTPTRTATKVIVPPSKTPTSTPTATSTQPPVTVPTDTDTPTPTSTATAALVVAPTLTTCNTIPGSSLAAVADSYVDRTQADKNFGGAAELFVRPSAGVDKRALVRFDLGSIPPGKKVLGAILYVYNNQGDNYAVNVLRVTEPWDEMGVTWNNQPAADTGSAAGGFQLTADKCLRGTLLSSALVQGWVDDPGSNYGVMLYPPSGAGDVNFSSREGSNPPQLWVIYQ